MDLNDDPLKDVRVIFTPGHCFACESPIDKGLFCSDCSPAPAKTAASVEPTDLMVLPGEVEVRHLKDWQIAYVEPLSIFTYNEKQYIIATVIATFSPDDPYRPIKIERYGDYIYVYKDTLKPNQHFVGYEDLLTDYIVMRVVLI